MKKNVFFINAIVLTLSSLFLSGLAMGFRVYQSNRIGAEGMGLFQLLTSVYFLATNLSVSGVNLAVTRLVSEKIATGEGPSLRRIMGKCFAIIEGFGCAAAALLFFSAGWVGTVCLGDARTSLSLRVLAVGLPFLSASSCLRGYFLAARNSLKPAAGQILEQVVSIATCVAILPFFLNKGLEWACCGIAVGMTAGEICGSLFICTLFLLGRRRERRAAKGPKKRLRGDGQRLPVRRVFSISLPIALGYYLRSALVTVENMLIPAGLKKSGASYQSSLSSYGMVKGMVMPVLAFPSAFLSAFSMLLIPEVAEDRAVRHQNHIRYMACRVFQICLLFSFLVVGFFFFFSEDLGLALYQSREAGRLMRLLCPLIPFMYLDSIVDAMLKGLDQQVYSLKVNTADSSFRILLIFLLLPPLGMKGYLMATFFSVLFNASLSIGKLVKVISLRFSFGGWVIKPLLGALFAGFGSTALFALLRPFLPVFTPLGSLLCQGGAYLLLYALALRLTGALSREDLGWLKSVVCLRRAA